MASPFDRPSNISLLPRGGRDGFIADAAVRFEKLETSISMLQKEIELARTGLGLLAESAEQTQRMRAFEESLRNSREYKIEEILRQTRDLKERLDRAEGERTHYANLPFNTWDGVSKKLSELSALSDQIKAAEKRSMFLAASLVAAIAWVVIGYFF